MTNTDAVQLFTELLFQKAPRLPRPRLAAQIFEVRSSITPISMEPMSPQLGSMRRRKKLSQARKISIGRLRNEILQTRSVIDLVQLIHHAKIVLRIRAKTR
jgi:hypothetical protein